MQTKLAIDLNLTQEAISSYETERVTPSADILIKLADYFNTNIDYLLCRTNYDLPISDIKPTNINEEQFQLLNKINKLSETDIAKVEGYIDGLNSK
ncbi:MAG TPA: helix-turn-helix transcriptional regulator [Candidatus Onthousia excrementipullorum]|uniref:Helix-turn-helix transcriptional regulator n=1 Tax=Candidatus Onthousia excrementipullorum TaxID=2840884 RepID=A0A9D1DTF6_9FIRM|nr:helix-turn-helix transcriptional regulator [Candidatus Onthousia excrementipullorum]